MKRAGVKRFYSSSFAGCHIVGGCCYAPVAYSKGMGRREPEMITYRMEMEHYVIYVDGEFFQTCDVAELTSALREIERLISEGRTK